MLRKCAIYAIKAIMKIPREEIAIEQAVDRLLEILDVSGGSKDVRLAVATGNGRFWDAVISARGHTFVMEWRRSGSMTHVFSAISQLKEAEHSFPYAVIPVLCVPYMGEAGQQACGETKVSWLDLSGNGRIEAPGLFYWNLTNDNEFKRPGRPESAFASKGSRISRRLLMEPDRTFQQKTLASLTGLTGGHVSRILGKLQETGLIERKGRKVGVGHADRLLEAWRDEYRFSRHNVIRGHISAGAGDSLLRNMAETFHRLHEPYAATALPAAWQWTRFVGFRLCTLYIPREPSPGLKKDLGFREQPRGANTWLVVPDDRGVFDGAEDIDGVNCVHPVQIYLDLKDHPERAPEAAEELRNRILLRGGDDL